MNPENPSPEFADSAKIPQEDQAYFENEALNSATREMILVLNKEVQKEGPVKAELVMLLRSIQTKQLYAGERNEDGRQVFKTFEHYLREFRRIFVRQKGRHAGERYKQVTDALLHNRLVDAGVAVLPLKKSVYRKLSTVEPELQVDTWTRVVTGTDVNAVNPAKVVESAHALGDTKSKFPPPTASSEKPKLREAWIAFKADVVAEFGSSIQRHFHRLDAFIEKKGKDTTPKPAGSYAVLPRADVKAPDQETALDVKSAAASNTVQSSTIPLSTEAPNDTHGTTPHQFKLPDLGESLEGLNLPPRPFVTSQGGRVYIAFENGEHLFQYTDKGKMPNPGNEKKNGPYVFKPKTAKGVWELGKTLSGQALSAEVDRIAKQLEVAALKVQASGKAA